MFRELERKNKQLSPDECVRILKTEKRGVLSVNGDGGYPYCMPMNHFYNDADGAVYFHCGRSGHRLDALMRDSKVSFCTHNGGNCDSGEWALKVKSVIVFGTVEIIDDYDAVADITARLSRKFTSDEEYISREIELYGHETLILRLVPEHMSGKLVTES